MGHNEDRIEWIDVIKGITVLLVVFHHSILSAYLFDFHSIDLSLDEWVEPINAQLGSLRMPSFFLSC